MTGKWTRDPLVHFLLFGAILFAFFAWRGEEADPESRTIDVTREVQAALALQFENVMQRSPTDAELDGLVDRWVRDEVLYREALRLGLDQDDAVVRRRMARKMESLASAEAETAAPSDAVLEQWLAENPERFAEDARVSFDQLWFESESGARSALPRVEDSVGWQDLGGSISLPATVEDESVRAIEARFGSSFADGIADLEPSDGWSGPVASGFGWHLVRLRERDVGEAPPFADVRDRVEDEWRSATIAERRERAYGLLRDAYQVNIAE